MAVHWCRVNAHFHEEQVSIGVTAGTQACCELALHLTMLYKRHGLCLAQMGGQMHKVVPDELYAYDTKSVHALDTSGYAKSGDSIAEKV